MVAGMLLIHFFWLGVLSTLPGRIPHPSLSTNMFHHSRVAIKKYVQANHKDAASSAAFETQLNKAIRTGVEKGEFEQPKGTSGDHGAPLKSSIFHCLSQCLELSRAFVIKKTPHQAGRRVHRHRCTRWVIHTVADFPLGASGTVKLAKKTPATKPAGVTKPATAKVGCTTIT